MYNRVELYSIEKDVQMFDKDTNTGPDLPLDDQFFGLVFILFIIFSGLWLFYLPFWLLKKANESIEQSPYAVKVRNERWQMFYSWKKKVDPEDKHNLQEADFYSWVKSYDVAAFFKWKARVDPGDKLGITLFDDLRWKAYLRYKQKVDPDGSKNFLIRDYYVAIEDKISDKRRLQRIIDNLRPTSCSTS